MVINIFRRQNKEMAKGYILKEPDLVLDPSLPEEAIIAAVDKLF